MVICFAGSTQNISAAIDDFREIIHTIHNEGHLVARDWLEPTLTFEKKQSEEHIDWNDIYEQNIKSLSTADLLIADATYDSFGVGFLTAFAIQQKKPILVLCKEGGKQGVILKGLHGDFVVKKTYTEKTLSKVVSKFIKDHTIEHKDLRFNFYLSPKQFAYLNLSSHQTGKTKAEIVRELIDKEI